MQLVRLRKRSAGRTAQFLEDNRVDWLGRLSIRAIDKKVNEKLKLDGSSGRFWVLALGYKCFLSSSGMDGSGWPGGVRLVERRTGDLGGLDLRGMSLVFALGEIREFENSRTFTLAAKRLLR
ncbi:hypothetical protein ACMFMF_006202 [Clarireedia jacksonii]